MKSEIKIKTYEEWLKYYENATKEDVIYDLTKDVEYFADAVKDIKQLQQELTDYKEICKLALEYIEKNKFDYEVKEKGFYMIQGVVPEFRLRELLKGQLTIEGMKKILDKKDNVVTIRRDMTHFFDGVAELDTTPLLSSEEILKMIREEQDAHIKSDKNN